MTAIWSPFGINASRFWKNHVGWQGCAVVESLTCDLEFVLKLSF
jgi:hypothetical protein